MSGHCVSEQPRRHTLILRSTELQEKLRRYWLLGWIANQRKTESLKDDRTQLSFRMAVLRRSQRILQEWQKDRTAADMKRTSMLESENKSKEWETEENYFYLESTVVFFPKENTKRNWYSTLFAKPTSLSLSLEGYEGYNCWKDFYLWSKILHQAGVEPATFATENNTSYSHHSSNETPMIPL